MTNKNKTTLYIGVTSDLYSRIIEHKEHKYPNSFTAKYCPEYCITTNHFITLKKRSQGEKEIKKWRREKKDILINAKNPNWDDLFEEIKSW